MVSASGLGGVLILLSNAAAPLATVDDREDYAMHGQSTLDYQFIADPAYNEIRGPVHVIGFRVHGEF